MGWAVNMKLDDETVNIMKYYVAEKLWAFRRGGAGLITVYRGQVFDGEALYQ